MEDDKTTVEVLKVTRNRLEVIKRDKDFKSLEEVILFLIKKKA